MKKVSRILVLVLFILLFLYIYPQSPEFPKSLPNSVQSTEPGDMETPLRRAYYTNLSREEVINYYKKEFNLGYNIYTPRFNYPPEEAQTLIRDQTKSSFLEEIVHPLRESLYINGFEPKTDEYAYVINGVKWNQKITVKYVSSTLLVRFIVLGLTLAVTLLLIENLKYAKK